MASRNRNRGNRQQDHNLKHGRGAQAATTPKVNGMSIDDFLKNFRLSDLLAPPQPPPGSASGPGPAGPKPAQESGYGASRWNSLKAGLRAKHLFPASMQDSIEERSRDFAAQRQARSLLGHWLCLEMARASVKIDTAHELLAVDLERVLGRVETSWDLDMAERADRRAQKLQDQPYDVARELGRSKYGAELLISRWQILGEAVASNQRLDESQVQMAYDLLAVPKVLRNGCRQVPAADDAPALAALVEREVARHRANLERTLNATDQSDRAAARLGMFKGRDRITGGLRADLSRAERRFKWADETFDRLRQGVDPATIVDPDTNRPITPDAHAAPASKPASSDVPPAPESPQESAPESSASEVTRPSVPAGAQPVDAEMLYIAGEAIGTLFGRSSPAKPPTGEPPAPLA